MAWGRLLNHGFCVVAWVVFGYLFKHLSVAS
jgi:hypothetical protein